MGLRTLLWALFLIASVSANDSQHRDRTDDVLAGLWATAHGKALLERAFERWGVKSLAEIKPFLVWDRSSRTDSTLIRQFDFEKGVYQKLRRTRIHLREGQTLSDTVLDLAHELVHAIADPSYDPYDPRLTAGQFILQGIEGRGGELDAIEMECHVENELAEIAKISQRRCTEYLGARAPASQFKDFAIKSFYQVGKFKQKLSSALGKEVHLFPHLTTGKPRLLSSTRSAPYPVALFNEYRELNSQACQNSKQRLNDLLRAELTPQVESMKEQLLLFLSKRCSS